MIQTVNGVVTGMILALVASGLTLIFGIMDVVNFAHGELFMLGAYAGVVMVATGNFWLALIVFSAGGRDARRGAAGCHLAAADQARSARHDPGHVRHIADPAELRAMVFRPDGAQDIRANVRAFQALLSGISVVSAGDRRPFRRRSSPFWLFLKYSKFGVWIRATTQDRTMAQAMGIPVPWVYTGVYAIGAAMAAASGVLFAPMAGVTHTMGLDWVLKAFIVVVVGDMGSPAARSQPRSSSACLRPMRRSGSARRRR